ncbi:YwmB family TATA-box binding protein [Chengkuizengella axinellae]|uniref:YwmB family TATA-box binding protein n=1 Tax=Chengkuizengella axinellae TaxID=3064388 RepID=A0ABT9J0G5_9BACL|nr:YwmB family TATA-box binding protein [Chengkuizengella sp. 2205SS18-9]MDP5275060.1 YwmB family TATA-box binding protein [Chengkuizengella sp. 2205SS18-9]
MVSIFKNKTILSLFIFIALLFSSLSYYIYASAEDDFSQFVSLSGDVFPENYQFILKHSGLYKSYEEQGSFEQLGDSLMSEFHMPQSESLIDSGHLVYQSEVELDSGTNLVVRLAGIENEKITYLTLILESDQHSLGSLSTDKTQIETVLEILNIQTNWNTMLQGKYSNHSDDDFNDLWKSLNNKLQLNEIETYTDERTVSTSFYSSKLNSEILSGSNRMNLQVALHQNSINDEWQLTIGSPIITIEY